MASNGGDASSIIREIERLKTEKSDIESQISLLQAQLNQTQISPNGCDPSSLSPSSSPLPSRYEAASEHGLTPDMIHRYSRHLLLPSFGVDAQSRLLKSSILVVGAGGLGSPALLYLAACGVGRLGIVDNDVVELNNMHRQDPLLTKYPSSLSLTAYSYFFGALLMVLTGLSATNDSIDWNLMQPEIVDVLYAELLNSVLSEIS